MHFERTLQCPLMAHSGHARVHRTCPLLGVKRTSFREKRTLADTASVRLSAVTGTQIHDAARKPQLQPWQLEQYVKRHIVRGGHHKPGVAGDFMTSRDNYLLRAAELNAL